MAFYGSAACNQSPILFKGNNRALGINMIIHNDESASMDDVNLFFSDGTFVEAMQNALLNEKIGDDVVRYPNLYSYIGLYSRNSSSNFTITNINGSLIIQNSFLLGENTGSLTKTNWVNNYINNIGNFYVNVCNQNNRLFSFNPASTSGSPYTEDVHGNLWSIYTTPNSILSGNAGRYGSIISSIVRKGSKNIIISASDEQDSSPPDMIGISLNTPQGNRTINGTLGEILFREYRFIALSSYNSTDGYDGVLFYGTSNPFPYGYVNLTGSSTYIITRSATPPSSWVRNTSTGQIHNTLLLAQESLGGLFKLRQIFTNTGTDKRVAFTNCITEFLVDTL